MNFIIKHLQSIMRFKLILSTSDLFITLKDHYYFLYKLLGRWQSGLMHLTVNQAAKAFGGSNPSLPTFFKKLNYQYVRTMIKRYFAVVAQLVEHQPSKLRVASSNLVRRSSKFNYSYSASGEFACVAQLAEHVLGKDEVTGSIPVVGSKINFTNKRRYFNG